jgi:Collagen triple helix repeat (20 copies)
MLRGVAAYVRLHHLGLLALFVALGGTSFAAAGAIKGTQIAPHSIPKNRLTGGAIKSLKGGHGAQGVVGAQGPKGSRGPTGPTGPTGAAGPTGPAGAKGTTGPAGAAGPTGARGATGSSGTTGARGPTGTEGPTGSRGATGPTGPKGATGHGGPTGPTGVVGTGALNGGIAPTIANSNIYVFVGPTLSVTTTTGQRLVGSAVALLGSTGGTNIWYGLCYKPSTISTLQNWAGIDYLETPVAARQPFAVSASVAPGTGTFTVGFCVKNNGASNLDDNNWVNGWVEVVNATALN